MVTGDRPLDWSSAEALAFGKTADEVRRELETAGLSGATLEAAIPHRVFPGNRPSTTILLDALDARRLGALLAMYEHKVFVQSVIWNLNPFDQFGVELGKQIAKGIEPWLAGETGPGLFLEDTNDIRFARQRVKQVLDKTQSDPPILVNEFERGYVRRVDTHLAVTNHPVATRDCPL